MAVSRRKIIYPLVAILVLFGLLVIAVFYIQLKDLEGLRDMVAEEIREETSRDVTIGSAQLDFSEGIGLQLEDVTLKGATEQESDFTCKKVLVLLHVLPLLNGEIKIQKLIFEGLIIQVTRDDKGNFNFGDLASVDSQRSGATFSDLLRAGLMHSVQVRKSELWLVDHSIVSTPEPLVTKVTHLSLSINKPLLSASLRVHLMGEVPFEKEKSGSLKMDGIIRIPTDASDLSKVEVEGNLSAQDMITRPFQPYLAKVFEQGPGHHHVDLTTRFTGTLDGRVQLSGTLQHTELTSNLRQGLHNLSLSKSGSLDYNLIFNRDTVHFKKLDYRWGTILLKIRGTFAGFLSDRPWLTVSLDTNRFDVRKSATYLPLKVFSVEAHDRLHRILKQGEIEIVSLNIEGPPALFAGRSNAEIQEKDSGSIILHNVDLGVEGWPLKGVTGEFHFKKGVAQFKIHDARYERLSIKNVSGTVKQPLTEPIIEGTLEAEGALAPLALMIEKKWTLPSKLGFLKDLRRIQGVGRGKFSIQGPLLKKEQLVWSGSISLERAGFTRKGWSTPAHNINGNIQFKSVAAGSVDAAGKEGKDPTWTLRFENFSGEFGNHYFREIQAESTVINGLPVKKIQGKIRLGALKAEELITTPFEGEIPSLLKNILFESGEIDFNFKNIGIGPGRKQPQNQGTLEIKKLFLKHTEGFRPLKDLNVRVSFDDHDIKFETTGGWYGDSPLELKGRFKNYSEAGPELILEAHFAEFMNQDFAGIPFLETLEYRGPAKVDLKFHGTDRFVTLEKRVDLTRASYRYRGFLIKPENISNSIELSAVLSPNGRIDFSRMVFELEGSRVIGEGFLKSMDDPQFSIQLKSNQFKAWPASQYIRPLQGALGGHIRFHASAEGNFKNLDEAVLNGKIQLKEVEYKPENFLVPIKLDANMKFENKHFNISKGKLSAEGTSLFFSGDYRGGETPHIKIQLVGSELNLDKMISTKEKPSTGFMAWLGGTRVFSKGSGEIDIKINRFNKKPWKLPEVAGKLTFKNRVLETKRLALGQPKIDEVLIRGTLNLSDTKNPEFDVVLISRDTRIEKLFGMFGGLFRSALTGTNVWMKVKLKGRGGDLKQIAQSLQGQWSFDIKEGRIHTGFLLNGTAQLFDVPVDPKIIAERDRQHNTGYMRIFGDFPIVNGVAHTENFMYEDKGDRVLLVGSIDLYQQRLDLVAGVAPFRRVSRWIEKIPILGKIITGGSEGSLITSYYEVAGPFSGPRIESIPWTTIGKKILGTFEGIITAPVNIIPHEEPDEGLDPE